MTGPNLQSCLLSEGFFNMHMCTCTGNKGNKLWFEVGMEDGWEVAKDLYVSLLCHSFVEATYRLLAAGFGETKLTSIKGHRKCSLMGSLGFQGE